MHQKLSIGECITKLQSVEKWHVFETQQIWNKFKYLTFSR